MNEQCMRRVWDHSSQKGSAFLLLLAIASYADDDGFACPGLAALAARIRMSRRQTMRLVARLERAGELLVLRRSGLGNFYIVCTGAAQETLTAAVHRAVRFDAALSGAALPARSGTIERILDPCSPSGEKAVSPGGEKAVTAIQPGPGTP
jgi:hypothetical protein